MAERKIELNLPSAEWFAQALHDVYCPIEEIGQSFYTWHERHPGKTIFEVSKGESNYA